VRRVLVGVAITVVAAVAMAAPASAQVVQKQYQWHAVATKVPTLGATTIATVGDSITAGVNSTAALFEAGWRYVFVQDAVAAGKKPRMVGNQLDGDAGFNQQACFGFPGAQIDGLISSASPLFWQYGHPDIVIFANNGTNNITNGDSAATTASKLTTMLTAARGAAPGALFVVTDMVPRNDALESVSVTYNGLIPSICSSLPPCLFVGMHSIVTGAQVQVGGVHPTDSGYTTMGHTLWSAVAAYANTWN